MDFDPQKNYYEILGVGEDASADEIKKVFRKAAVKHHPDRWGSKEKFQEINEAYQVLSDQSKRQQYDAYRKGGFWAGGFGWGGFDFWGFGWWGAQIDFGDIGDLLGGMFGGGFWWGRSKRKTKGDDLEKQIEISFEEAFLGVKKKIAYTREVLIEGTTQETCSHCHGTGRVSQQVQSIFGVVQTQAACPKCQWTGTIFKKDGKELENGGVRAHKEILELNIPAGIKHGAYLKYAARGNDAAGLPTGDLYVKINVASSEKYSRIGDNIHIKAEVSLFDLVLWGEVQVPHPAGKTKVKIPKGTQIGQKVRVANMGFGEKGLFSHRGDMIVELQVHVPKKLTKEQEKLWKDLQELG